MAKNKSLLFFDFVGCASFSGILRIHLNYTSFSSLSTSGIVLLTLLQTPCIVSQFDQVLLTWYGRNRKFSLLSNDCTSDGSFIFLGHQVVMQNKRALNSFKMESSRFCLKKRAQKVFVEKITADKRRLSLVQVLQQ